MRKKRNKWRDSLSNRVNNRIEDNKALPNKPFKGLLKDLKDFDQREEPVASSSPTDNSSLTNNTTEESDEDLFQIAMRDVTPLKGDKNKIVRYPVTEDKLHDWKLDPGKKVGENFSSLVKESAAWDISFSDEYMEGAVSGVGPKIMKRLKRGEFSIQDHIDLHGLTKKEAETIVNEFIIQSYQKGLRCVLIVHGRGLGSVDHQPAIKKELPVWFKKGILKRIVLAFVTARPFDGGAGALYVLLKKR